jgi:hypothetical protein
VAGSSSVRFSMLKIPFFMAWRELLGERDPDPSSEPQGSPVAGSAVTS